MLPSPATTCVMGCKSPGVKRSILHPGAGRSSGGCWWVISGHIRWPWLPKMLMKGTKICLFSGNTGNTFIKDDYSKPPCNLSFLIRC